MKIEIIFELGKPIKEELRPIYYFLAIAYNLPIDGIGFTVLSVFIA